MSAAGLSQEELRARHAQSAQRDFGPFGSTFDRGFELKRFSSFEELLDFRQAGRSIMGDPGESADPNFVPEAQRNAEQNQKAVEIGTSRRTAGGTITRGTNQLTNQSGTTPTTAPAAAPSPGPNTSVTRVGGGLMGVIEDTLSKQQGSMFKAASTTLLGG